MATYYVYHGGNNTTGADWTNAKTTLAAAVTAATTAGDIILVASDHTGDNALAADTTYTAGPTLLSIISVNRTTNVPELMSSFIGHASLNRSVTFNSAALGRLYLYGLAIKISGSTVDSINLQTANDGHIELENCELTFASTASNSRLILGNSGSSTAQGYVRLVNTSISFANASQCIQSYAIVEMYTCYTAGAALYKIFQNAVAGLSGGNTYCEGCDFSSAASGAYIIDNSSQPGPINLVMVNCKLPTSFIMMNAGVNNNKSTGEVTLYNCASGDTHYFLGHKDELGSTIAVSNIYPNDSNTGNITWFINSTAYATFGTPYYTPWFDVYHSGTASITPTIEILREGSTTAYKDDEVWADFSFQATANSTQSTIKTTRPLPLATGTNIPTGIGVANWTGDTGAWSGVITSPATTPAEVGHLRARVCVGKASVTDLYVDPTIRL